MTSTYNHILFCIRDINLVKEDTMPLYRNCYHNTIYVTIIKNSNLQTEYLKVTLTRITVATILHYIGINGIFVYYKLSVKASGDCECVILLYGKVASAWVFSSFASNNLLLCSC